MRFREFLDHLGIVMLIVILTALVVLFIKSNTVDDDQGPQVDPPWEIHLR